MRLASTPSSRTGEASADERDVEAGRAEVDADRIGPRDVRQKHAPHELVDAHRLDPDAVARLVGEREREQLVDEAARPLLALQDALELLAPDLGLAARQAVFGERADAGERRAQVVRDVARELALRLHARADAREQRVDGIAQLLDVARDRRAADRVEIARVAPVELALEIAERMQLAVDDAPEVDAEHQQQRELRQQRALEQAAQQRRACASSAP